MASIQKRGARWRARVLLPDGSRPSNTFRTRAEALAWAQALEAGQIESPVETRTLRDALARYAREVAPTHKGERWEVIRCASLERDPMADKRLAGLTTADLADWRDRRLKQVAPASVRREMNLLRSVLEVARKEWGWLRRNPIDDVRRPSPPASRKRRVSQAEAEAVALALGYDGGVPETDSQRIALAWLFALETAMRSGEILGLTWADVGEKSVALPATKNGDKREVPLSSRAREILALLPRDGSTVFNLDARSRDALFRKARNRTGIADLHFHDSRAEAIWRLSKKLDVMELARVIGHRDLRSLLIYYQASAAELADKLG